jgi:hypothetical protein
MSQYGLNCEQISDIRIACNRISEGLLYVVSLFSHLETIIWLLLFIVVVSDLHSSQYLVWMLRSKTRCEVHLSISVVMPWEGCQFRELHCSVKKRQGNCRSPPACTVQTENIGKIFRRPLPLTLVYSSSMCSKWTVDWWRCIACNHHLNRLFFFGKQQTYVGIYY